MPMKTIFAVAALCLLMCFAIGFVADVAHAQEYMERKGIEGLFAGKKDMEGKGPTSVQKWIGLGSCVVMVIVVKWL